VNAHFDQHLNVRELMLAKRPRLVVECGAGGGDNTTKLLSLQPELGFRLVVINDGPQPEGIEFAGLEEWVCGLSYLELPKYPGVDFCLIDTDHNYPTLKWELDALRGVMPKGGIVCLHDTVTYGKNNGDMRGYYRVKHGYPSEEIARANRESKGMVDAVFEAADAFKLIRLSEESHGAMALERL
jgi:hypothetical protein